jgi:hypothetical protein
MLKKPQGFADEHLTDERICYSHIKVHNITLWATDFQKLLHYQHNTQAQVIFCSLESQKIVAQKWFPNP